MDFPLKRRFFAKFHKKNPFVNFLYNERLNRVFNLLPSTWENLTILDLGCSSGYFTQALPVGARKVGMDIERSKIVQAKKHHGRLVDFVLGDINFLPFRKESVHIIVSISVLEHLMKLRDALKEIGEVLKKRGLLIVGYPITNSLAKMSIKILVPSDYKCIDPGIMGRECFDESPSTHKQDYRKIRETLSCSFVLVEKDKIPFRWFPDFLSIYESVKMVKSSTTSAPCNSCLENEESLIL